MDSIRLELDSSNSLSIPASLKVRAKSQDSDFDSEFAVLPDTPLLSTAVEENCFVCGRNNVGQLGVGTQGDVLEPQPVQFARHWAHVSFGDYHACGISLDGKLYSWGLSNKGQLGHEDEDSRELPESVECLKCDQVKNVACGCEHTVAVTETDVYTWGSNASGQLGHDDHSISHSSIPRPIGTFHDKMVTQVVCGRSHTLAVTAQSQVFAWGANNYGQLGLGDKTDRSAPKIIEALWALPIKQLAAGEFHSCVLTRSGYLFTWGLNNQGQLGQTSDAEHAAAQSTGRSGSSRRRITKKLNQQHLTALMQMGIPSDQAELALMETKNGGVELAAEWLFGNSTSPSMTKFRASQLKKSTEEESLNHHQGNNKLMEDSIIKSVLVPKRVPLKGVRFIAAGGNHSIAICQDSVYSWGAGDHGQLGLGEFSSKNLPQKIIFPNHEEITQVACGKNHSLFLTQIGSIYGTGSNECGQLGQIENLSNEVSCFAAPVELNLPFLSLNQHRSQKMASSVIVQISAGDNSSSFLTASTDDASSMTMLMTIKNCASLSEKLEHSICNLETCDRTQLAECSSKVRRLAALIETVFASAAALNITFSLDDCIGIDFEKLYSVQKRLLSMCSESYLADPLSSDRLNSMDEILSMTITEAMSKAFAALLHELSSHLKLLHNPERAQLLLAAAQHPLLDKHSFAKSLLPKLCLTVLNAPSGARSLLSKGWAEYSGLLLKQAVIHPLQAYVTKELTATKKLTVTVMNAIKVLSKVHEANEKGRKLPPEAFYNQLISEKMDVLDHYIAWRQSRDHPPKRAGQDGPFSFCSYPFLLDARAKGRLLHTEAKLQMEQTVAHSRLENVYGPFKKSRRETDEARVLPNRKQPLKKEEQELKKKRSGQSAGESSRNRSRRGDSSSLRSLVYNIFRSSHSDHHRAGLDENTDSGTNERAESSLARAGSLQLPRPEDCEIEGTSLEMCILRVRRNHLLEDALNEISRQHKKDLFKPLRVHFIGEEGIDGGGVKKEFFQLLVHELLSPDYGMLIYQAESNTYWFNPALMFQKESYEDEMYLMGLVIGLAVYNGVLLDFPLPLAFYKKLIQQELVLQDLEEMQPIVGRSLRQLQDYDGKESIENIFCQTMSTEVDVFGEIKRIPLVHNGEDIMVSQQNRTQFVKLYVDYVLSASIRAPFEAFSKGLRTVCGGPAIHLFNAQELERLVCGNPNLDFEALENHTRYDGGFNKSSQTVKWLWEVVSEFSLESKKLFLKFFTGSDRAPIGGLGNLKCVIQQNGSDDRKLPTAHTCFNTLLLPNYSTREDLHHRLKLAIMNSEGFGLE
eukprot:g1279.t1